MPRAVLKNGVIRLVEPLPPEWRDGTELQVERSSEGVNVTVEESTDRWMDEVEALAARIPAGDDEKLVAAIAFIRGGGE
jgi:hypothetical protein